ncbi:B12-binding domain-containing radical SAM protein [Candidatus Fermentibacteria bacterium]|nr:B12-binding domain-containing radical SAM protein [Candidatus Fermentibacteria bacterium]
MKVKLILPALTEARSPYFRPIKYSLFPPLGLATLASYLSPDDEVTLCDEHVERLDLHDEPELVAIETYVTAARRSYEIADNYRAKGAYVCIGGIHPTSLPDEAAQHADTVFLGPGEDTWPRFLEDFRACRPQRRYQSAVRSLVGAPPPRRNLIKRHKYFVPNSLIVSRGCPQRCDFCYKEAFFAGGRSFYTQAVDDALAEVDSLPGRHLFFLDDNLFADKRFTAALCDGMRGMGRLWQGAATVAALFDDDLLDNAAACGMRSLFVGFETLSREGLSDQNKVHNLNLDYALAIRRLHDRGVMVNASFVFGMDYDDESVFDATVDWAVAQGIETATFHILTPYPGTILHQRLAQQGRILTSDWDLYDTRHSVFRPARMSPETLEAGYWRAYERFYSWRSILSAAYTKPSWQEFARHVAYSGGWKKCEPLWAFLIHTGLLGRARGVLERVLEGFGHRDGVRESASEGASQDECAVAPLPM